MQMCRFGPVRSSTLPPPASAEPLPIATQPQPEQAWKALSITNEWVRHADSKTGVTLAFAGATAAVLYSLVGHHATWTCALTIVVAIAALAILFVVISAAIELVPRVTRKGPDRPANAQETVSGDDTVNLLFFGDIHRHYAEDRPTYRDVLSTLTSDPARLTGQLADQIHANARIATVKFRWANRAILAELAAAAAVAVTAFLVATGW